MARKPKKKTSRQPDGELMKRALEDHRNGSDSIRKSAEKFGIPYPTFRRYVLKYMENPVSMKFEPNYSNRQIFSTQPEAELANYLLACANMCYGLTTTQCRELAYKLAKSNDIQVPYNWERNQAAGIDWFYSFRQRNPTLAIRNPEACSLSRATSFNKHNVNMFFDNLQDGMQREPKFCDGTRIYNLDETSTKTVPDKQQNVIAGKGMKQVNQATSGEKGILVTTCCIVSAAGNSLPPIMIFPRKKVTDVMFEKAPCGTLALSEKSGWMTGENFAKVMTHFVKHSASSKENPSLLILDNHESHLDLKALDTAKENGVTIVTLPPHTSCRLQPLDVSCYGPFKTYYTGALQSVLFRKSVPLTIYNIAECVNIAHERSLTPSNIKSGFKKAGIFPFDRHIFTNDDFAPSLITDRPPPENAEVNLNLDSSCDVNIGASTSDVDKITFYKPSSDDVIAKSTAKSAANLSENATANQYNENPEYQAFRPPPEDAGANLSQDSSLNIASSTRIPTSDVDKMAFCKPSSDDPADIETGLSVFPNCSPTDMRPFPKAEERKRKGGRKKGKSIIATDTPVKNELEERKRNKHDKKRKITNVTHQAKKKIRFDSDSESEDGNTVKDFDDGMSSTDDISLCDDEIEELYDFPDLDLTNVKKDNYVLVGLKDEKRPQKEVMYVAQIVKEKNESSEFEVKYLKKSTKVDGQFYLPSAEEIKIYSLPEDCIKMILQNPKQYGVTKRQNVYISFGIHFKNMDVR